MCFKSFFHITVPATWSCNINNKVGTRICRDGKGKLRREETDELCTLFGKLQTLSDNIDKEMFTAGDKQT